MTRQWIAQRLAKGQRQLRAASDRQKGLSIVRNFEFPIRMKIPALLCLIVLLSANLATARVVVYKESERSVVTGNSRTQPVNVRTYVVFDPDTRQFVAGISYFALGATRLYTISTDLAGYVVSTNVAGKTGQYTVFAKSTSTNDGPNVTFTSFFAKGMNSELPIGNGENVFLPKSLKAVSRGLVFPGGIPSTYESTSTMTFQARETVTSNVNNETAEQVIERLRAALAKQGYTPAS